MVLQMTIVCYKVNFILSKDIPILVLGHFDLNALNVELQKLVIAIDGPSKADIQIEVVDTGIYRVFYTCQTPGRKKNQG